MIELHKRQASEVVESAIWDVLNRKGIYHADDLHDYEIPAEGLNSIGARINALRIQGFVTWVCDRRAAGKASHGRRSGVYRVTDKGRAELKRRAGVGGSNRQTDRSFARAASHPGDDVAPEELQLPLGDVGMAQTDRATYADDWDMAA